MIKYSDIFLNSRVTYISEVLRQMATSHQQTVAVVDHELIPFIEEEWSKLPQKPRALDSLLKGETDI